jgi:hypothetical protein
LPLLREAAERYMQAAIHTTKKHSMKRKIYYFFTAFAIISCGKKAPEETFIDFKPNENVISCKIRIVNDKYPDKSPDSLFAKNFDPKTDTIKFNEKEIYISYITDLTGCVKYGGDVEVKKDSLLLKLVRINNIACTELNIARVVYRINNPKNMKYKIAKFE